MSIHYFDLHQPMSGVTSDEEGLGGLSDAAMRNYAIRAARELMAEEVRNGVLGLDSEIVVRDAAGAVCLVLRFRDAVALH